MTGQRQPGRLPLLSDLSCPSWAQLSVSTPVLFYMYFASRKCFVYFIILVSDFFFPQKRQGLRFCFYSTCNREGLILNLFQICFCDFNPHLATFVIVGRSNGLPQGDYLSHPPVKDCKEVKLTCPPACGLPF